MIIPDANLLIYAHNKADPQHKIALTWWRGLLSGDDEIGIPMAVVAAFIRLTTSPRVLSNPLTVEESSAIVRDWFSHPNVRLLHTTADHIEHFLRLLIKAGTGGNLTTDAHIAALAVEYQAQVHTADTDFARFSGVRWKNPLGE